MTESGRSPSSAGAQPVVVALVPVKDGEDKVAETVSALLSTGVPDRVIVIDDGSEDDTADVAAAAGARVLRLEVNRGKGGALRVGIDDAPDADIFLLVDADLRSHAAVATALVDEVTADRADLAIAVFPPSAGRAGAGRVRDFSRNGIRALSGQQVREPLSGQRAVRADLLRGMALAPRFGVEVGMTIDAARAGSRIVEIELPLEHDHTGRSWTGVRHRMTQGIHILRALLPRVGSIRTRAVAMVAVTVIAAIAASLGGAAGRADGELLAEADDRTVVMVGVPRLSFVDLEEGAMPRLRSLAEAPDSLVATMTVRFPSRPSDAATGFATVSAGAPVAMTEQDDLSTIDETEGLGPGENPDDPWPSPPVRLRDSVGDQGGWQVFTRLEPLPASEDSRSYGTLGALGQEVRDAGLRTGFVGAGLLGGLEQTVVEGVPSALMVADRDGRIDMVDGNRASTVEVEATEEQIQATLRDIVDRVVGTHDDVALLGVDSPRFAWPRPAAPEEDPDDPTATTTTTVPVPREVLEDRRLADLQLADRLVGDLLAGLPGDVTVLVAGITPPVGRWELTPIVLLNAGAGGELTSPSTQRSGIVTLTDLAPTALHLLGLDQPRGMIGAAATRSSDVADLEGLSEIGRRASDREGTYSLAIVPFVVAQALIYGAYLAFGQRSRKTGRLLERLSVASAAWPLSTFLIRALPVGWTGPVMTNVALLVVALAIGWVAVRSRYHPLGPLVWVCTVTAVLIGIDMATGAHLQESSLIGYSPLTAARFYGLGNMAFAVFATASLIVAGALVTWTPRRTDGLIAAGCILSLTLWIVAHPSLGADIGGLVTLVPVYGVVMAWWAGLRFSARNFVLILVASAVFIGLLGLAMTMSGTDTHLSGFLAGGGDEALATIRRKLETNWRVLRITTWSWMVPIVVAFLVVALFPRRNPRIRLGGSSLRVTFLGIIAVGVVGGLVNDSGVVITAMSLIYVGTFLILMLERRPFSDPVVIDLRDIDGSGPPLSEVSGSRSEGTG
jgi:hypothetical protein